jgi:hypothetical protein
VKADEYAATPIPSHVTTFESWRFLERDQHVRREASFLAVQQVVRGLTRVSPFCCTAFMPVRRVRPIPSGT